MQYILTHHPAASEQLLLVRVTGTHTLAPGEREEAVAYHCFRGCLTPDTALYLHALGDEPSPAAGFNNTGAGGALFPLSPRVSRGGGGDGGCLGCTLPCPALPADGRKGFG
jgi:hypothetical protein